MLPIYMYTQINSESFAPKCFHSYRILSVVHETPQFGIDSGRALATDTVDK